jgi:kinesin family protein 6/9
VGDGNKLMAENYINAVSSRSHCIFTIFIEAVPIGSDVRRVSKLHIVDLAGYVL